MDLKSYSSKESDQKNPAPSHEDIMSAISKYSKLSNDELMLELAKHMNIQRGKGRNDEISSTIERIKPLLNNEQKKKLEEILKRV